MIIWRGLGWIVAVIVFGFSLVANFVFDGIFGKGYYTHHNWPLSFLCWPPQSRAGFLATSSRAGRIGSSLTKKPVRKWR